MELIRKIAALGGIALLAACASTPPIGGAPGVQVASVDGLPSPAADDYLPDPAISLLRPLDVVRVDVFGVPELSRDIQVGAAGSIDFPLIGAVPALGRTPEEVSLEIENRLRGSYILEPDVTTRVIERVERTITIGGEVQQPGRYPVTSTITLMEAVAIGGGMEEYAQRDEVLVFRTVGGERYIGVYNVRGIQRGNYADPTIYPGDIVIVGDSPNRRRLDQILQITSSILTPLVLIDRVAR